MQHETIAKRLQELGHTTRLSVYRMLIKSGPDGISVGKLQKKLKIPASTLSHHLSRLRSVGLITQERIGTVLVCRPQIKALNAVVDYLKSECCRDINKKC